MTRPLIIKSSPDAEHLRRLPWPLVLLRVGAVLVLAVTISLLLR